MIRLTNEQLKDTVLIVCDMIREEVSVKLEETGYPGEIVWMQKSLHVYPEKLRAAIQEEVDKWQHKSYILLGFGLCGNGMLGIHSEKATLIIPAFDDCVRMLQCLEKGAPIRTNSHSMYYTDSWLDGFDEDGAESALAGDKYQKIYGEKKGLKILKAMLKTLLGILITITKLIIISK